MAADDIDRRVRETLALALGIEVPQDGPFERVAVPRWDSLKHVEVIFMLEDEFGVQFAETEFPQLTGVDAIVARVETHLAA